MRNLWIASARQRSRRLRVEAPGDEGRYIGEDPRAGMDAKIDLQRVMAVMECLPDEQREVVALVLIEGLGYQEAADLLDLPVGTVSSRLARGRIALLSMLNGATRQWQWTDLSHPQSTSCDAVILSGHFSSQQAAQLAVN